MSRLRVCYEWPWCLCVWRLVFWCLVFGAHPFSKKSRKLISGKACNCDDKCTNLWLLDPLTPPSKQIIIVVPQKSRAWPPHHPYDGIYGSIPQRFPVQFSPHAPRSMLTPTLHIHTLHTHPPEKAHEKNSPPRRVLTLEVPESIGFRQTGPCLIEIKCLCFTLNAFISDQTEFRSLILVVWTTSLFLLGHKSD